MLPFVLAVAQILITISPQPNPPYKLPVNISLYSAEMCAAPQEQRLRAVSAAQVRQVAEQAGIAFQDPAINATTINSASSGVSKLLTVTKYLAGGMAVAGAAISAWKTQSPNIGNAKTWGIIAAGAGALGAGIPIAQSSLQAAATAAVSKTTGLQAALISDMTTLYPIQSGGCSKSAMFFGSSVLTKPVTITIP